MDVTHIDQPQLQGKVKFGRLEWWVEESPPAFAAVAMLALVSTILLWLLLLMEATPEVPTQLAVSLQPVALPGTGSEPGTELQMEIEETLGAEVPDNRRLDIPVEMPDVSPNLENVQVERPDAESTRKTLSEEAQAARAYAEQLQKALAGGGAAAAPAGAGGYGDPNSTPARMSRWVIRYPPVPTFVYAQILDFFKVELGWESSSGTIEYVSGFSTDALRRRRAPVSAENRLFWFPANSVSLASDLELLERHGIRPGSTVIHFYPKEVEHKLAELELKELKRRYGTEDVSRVLRTVFEIKGTARGWDFEVSELHVGGGELINRSQ